MATETDMEQLFEDALTIADRHLITAMKENEELGPYVAIAMIEAAVNQSIDVSSPEDIVAILRDLATQIEGEMGGIEGDSGEGAEGLEGGEGGSIN